jgi:hypothetical protein
MLVCGAVLGQDRTALINSGAPMRVEFRCSEAEMEAAGLICTDTEPCPAYLELSAVAPVGAAVFLAGNIHTASVTLHSILLSSSDAGKTWREPYERIRGAALDQVEFLDSEIGWVSGQLVLPLPRDPFMLLTNDGGATWRRRPIFAESRPGAIERFHFTSRTGGVLWVDRTQSGDTAARYERYESATGGESWMLREVLNRPPPQDTRQETREPGWRLRTDPAAKSYRLERNRDGQWQTEASFLIPIGECKLPPP